MMCISQSSTGKLLRYFNDERSPSQQENATLGLSNIVITNNNGVLRCQFNRTNYISTSNYFNLLDSWFVLLAKGSLSGSKNIKRYNFLI